MFSYHPHQFTEFQGVYRLVQAERTNQLALEIGNAISQPWWHSSGLRACLREQEGEMYGRVHQARLGSWKLVRAWARTCSSSDGCCRWHWPRAPPSPASLPLSLRLCGAVARTRTSEQRPRGARATTLYQSASLHAPPRSPLRVGPTTASESRWLHHRDSSARIITLLTCPHPPNSPLASSSSSSSPSRSGTAESSRTTLSSFHRAVPAALFVHICWVHFPLATGTVNFTVTKSEQIFTKSRFACKNWQNLIQFPVAGHDRHFIRRGHPRVVLC